MVLLNQPLEALRQDVGVDFRRRNIRVPQQYLQAAQIGPTSQQM
jgi:hypothetical protein